MSYENMELVKKIIKIGGIKNYQVYIYLLELKKASDKETLALKIMDIAKHFKKTWRQIQYRLKSLEKKKLIFCESRGRYGIEIMILKGEEK